MRGARPQHENLGLQAGPVCARLDGIELRDIRVGDIVVAERIYVAVRDEPWNHLPATWSDIRVQDNGNSFEVNFHARHQSGEIDLRWSGRITGQPSGEITFDMDAEAARAFEYSKIGFCIHHPLRECRGRPYRASGGTTPSSGVLPDAVSPGVRAGALFPEYDELTIAIADDVSVTFHFSGDLFEMQDHRNWGDANFKTYGTPMTVPFPRPAQPGQHFHQSVRLTVTGGKPGAASTLAPAEVIVGAPRSVSWPAVGSRITEVPVTAGQLDRIRRLNLDHLRIDVHLPSPIWREELTPRLAVAETLGTPVQLALLLEPHFEEQLQLVLAEVTRSSIGISEVLVHDGAGDAVTATDTVGVVEKMAGAAGISGVMGGTALFFTLLNASPPGSLPSDNLFFPYSPQVHASDDRSVMANVRALPDMMARCRALTTGTVCISPVTLIPDLGPWAAGPPQEGDPAPTIDDRQFTAFAAAWLVAFLEQLVIATPASATVFDVVGARGLLAAGNPMGTPAYNVMATAAARGPQQQLLELHTQGAVAAVGWRTPERTELLVANIDAEPQLVRLHGLGEATNNWMCTALTTSDTEVDVLAVVEDSAGGRAVRLPGYGVAFIAS
jgi:hypothetical protein